MPITTISLALLVFTALTILPVNSATLSKSEDIWDQLEPSEELKWHPCYEDNFSCAKLDVPLDYHNLELGRAAVPLLRFAADPNSPDGAYKGQLLANPGGPGGSGIDLVLGAYDELVKIAGSNYDVVGFDPRGMDRSFPRASCNVDTTEESGNLTKRLDYPRFSDQWMEKIVADAKVLGQKCADAMGWQHDAGPHMSTAVNVRDLISITDAFAKSHYSENVSNATLLNFVGYSYGTIIAQVFASMYPDRVGHIMLDGVVSADDYFDNLGIRNVNNFDDVFAAFFTYCFLAGPTKCALASPTAPTPREIFDHFFEWFKTLDFQQADNSALNTTRAEDLLVKVHIAVRNAVYNPTEDFPKMARSLAMLEKIVKNGTISLSPFETEIDRIALSIEAQRLFAVECSDSGGKLYQKTLDDLREQIVAVERESIFGQTWVFLGVAQCTGWSIKATDTYLGPFGGNTETPMLFVSNTFDPVTPKANSLAALPLFNNSQLLTVDGIGHTSPQTQNKCYFAKAKAYFQNTTMPNENNFCHLDQGKNPFGVYVSGNLEDFVEAANLPIGTHHKVRMHAK